MISAARVEPPDIPPDMPPELFAPIPLSEDTINACTAEVSQRIDLLRDEKFAFYMLQLPTDDLEWIYGCWQIMARSDQLPPDGDWMIWLLLGGRGAGKTRAGAEWVHQRVHQDGARRIALVAPTYAEARQVMVEGESGLLNTGPKDARPVYQSSLRRVEWPNGASAQIYSAEDPDGLRGGEFDSAWADEFCAWAYPEDTLSNLRFGLRQPCGDNRPQLVMTTTPKPTRALKRLMATTSLTISRARTRDNAANLDPAFLAAVEDSFAGTRLGRQEMDGEIMEDLPGALWTRQMLDRAMQMKTHAQTQAQTQDYNRADYDKVIIALDPPVSTGARANACGIIVAGTLPKPKGHTPLIGGPRRAAIIFDGTVQGVSPEKWAARTAELFEQFSADYIVAEINQGGDLVKTVLRHAGAHMPIRAVRAFKNKPARAEPVALLYEQNRISHAGRFPDLEDELCEMGADTPEARSSPDRADACVWALTDLLLRPRWRPRIRML